MSADEIRSTVPLAASPQQTPVPDAGVWERCMDGDRQAFQQLMLSHLDELFAAARRDLRYHVLLGDLCQHDLSPEELVGETLLRAWRDRLRKPASLGIRPWLLGLQFRVLTRIVRQERLLQRLVSILDNFELGLAAAKTETEQSPIYSGMVLVQKQLNDLLEENGLQAIEAEGKKFDPNLHEAIAHEPSQSPEGTVIRQARRGYRFKDRLLRPARVVVSSGPAK